MTTNREALSEAEIRALIDARVSAIRSRDVDGSVADYAPDVLLFDVVNPLKYVGSDAVKKRAQDWFSSFQGPIGYEMQELSISAGDDVAFCHSLNGVNGIKTDGNKLNMWWRSTACYRKIDGKWALVHEHSSVPFDVTTGSASTGLKP